MIRNISKQLYKAIFVLFLAIGVFVVGTATVSAYGGWDMYGGSYYDSYSYFPSYDGYYDGYSGYGSYDCVSCDGYSSYYSYDSYNYDYNYDDYVCVKCNDTKVQTPALVLSCAPDQYSATTGEVVKWRAFPSGGNGSYSYSWSGSVAGNTKNVSKAYNNAGNKSATVTVTSGNKTKTANCGTVVVREAVQSLTGSCSVSDTSVTTGDSVRWSASASGGNGTYTYTWNGSYPLSGQTGNNVNTTYTSEGTKTGSVTIRSGNQEVTLSCGTVVVQTNEDSLSGSCYVSDSRVNKYEGVTWSANASGGNGTYTYTWNGSYPLSGQTGRSAYASYSSEGTKTGSVTIRSGNQEIVRSCGTVVVEEDDEEDNDDLSVSCRVSDTRVNVGDSVTFTADVEGGNSPFDYDWRGDIDGDDRSERVTFDDPGRYTVRVVVRDDDGNEDSDTCSTVVVEDDDDDTLSISCSVNTTSANLGQTVFWTTNVYGGTGSYRYSWNGTDNLSGNNSSVSKSYSSTGVKTARVRVTSGSQEKSLECPTTVIGGGGGVVLYQGPNNGNLASLSSVYLSQVPYTGITDDPKMLAYIITLALLSILGAYAIVKRKVVVDRKQAIAAFKAANMLRRK